MIEQIRSAGFRAVFQELTVQNIMMILGQALQSKISSQNVGLAVDRDIDKIMKPPFGSDVDSFSSS